MISFDSQLKKNLKEKMLEESAQLPLNDGGSVQLKRVMDILEVILNDRTVPKNIKAVIQGSKDMLSSKQASMEVKISSVINDLDSVINDPNMPLYTRTQIWNLVSLLEEERNKSTKNK